MEISRRNFEYPPIKDVTVPYITQERRTDLVVSGHDMESAGELNYILTRILNRYIEQHGLSYQTINDIMGALEGCKLEFYARVARPYEDTKIEANGDVYNCHQYIL